MCLYLLVSATGGTLLGSAMSLSNVIYSKTALPWWFSTTSVHSSGVGTPMLNCIRCFKLRCRDVTPVFFMRGGTQGFTSLPQFKIKTPFIITSHMMTMTPFQPSQVHTIRSLEMGTDLYDLSPRPLALSHF
ncbi:hypothetical protein NP493_570g03005 [Ridgeia piscesae]|uniref:Uncharacterized protein n=1 Tax=Ridgeia piscesae TaxID=27915 RepID=A0AAD9KV02_RIDPI|nr:hypothetical protein NP493_570g03005 [Ridgeia piscesae]